MRAFWLALIVCAMLVLPQFQVSVGPISLSGKTDVVYAWNDRDVNGDLNSNNHTGENGNGGGGDDKPSNNHP